MSDTTILPTVPAYVQINDGHRGHRDWNGVTDKDRMHLSTDALNAALRDMSQAIADDSGIVQVAVERNGRSAELATEKVGAAVNLSVEKTAAGSQLANSLAFSNTQNMLISGFKDGRFDAANYGAAAALAAAVNTAAIQAAIAECCCEQKMITIEQADKTRDLINMLNSQNNAVALVDAKNEILALRLSAKPL